MYQQTMRAADVNKHHHTGAQYGFDHGVAARELGVQTKKHQSLSEKTRVIAHSTIVVGVFACAVALGSGVFEAYCAREFLAGILGTGYLTSAAIGVAMSCVGMLGGYSLKKATERIDPVTGTRIFDQLFYCSLFLVLVYVGGLALMAGRAAAGLTGEAAFTAGSFRIMVAIVSIIEVLVGYIFVEDITDNIVAVLQCRFAAVQATLALRRMGTTAVLCERHMLYYEHGFAHYNMLHPDCPLVRLEETEAIKRARAYFRSHKTEQS